MKVYRILIVFLTVLLIVLGTLLGEQHEIASAGAMIAGGLGLVAIALALRTNQQ